MTTKNNDEFIYRIIEKLNGLHKQNASESLIQTLIMLGITKNPINIEHIRKIWFPEIERKRILEAMKYLTYDGHEHKRIVFNNTINIYSRITLWYSKILPNQSLYYTLSKDSSIYLRRLTKSNLLNDFRISPFESVITEFLKDNSPYKKNKGTNNYEILQVLDETTIFTKNLK